MSNHFKGKKRKEKKKQLHLKMVGIHEFKFD